jgi:hypothetical protein
MDIIIPNQFIFIFGLQKQKEPFHLCHFLCIESCYQVNRPERILFYYHYEPFGPYWNLAKKRVQLVRAELNPYVSKFRYGFKNRGCRKYRYAHQSDFLRLEILLEQGGVYADIDTIFVQRMPSELFRKPCVLGREDDVICQETRRLRPSLCNALIMSPPGGEFVRMWADKMREAFDGSWSHHSTFLPQELSEKHPDLIHVEPSRSFYRHMWTPRGLHTLLQGLDDDFSGVYSLHLWSHLWWSKKRTDFSPFHGGLLTEAHIRNTDTTYSLIARKFLPQGEKERRL